MDIKTLARDLYVEHGRKIVKFILKRNGGDFEVAEEVLQNTFVAFLKSYHTFQNKSSYFTWLCKIALNKLADYYRGQVNKKSKLIVPLATQIDHLIEPHTSIEESIALDELRVNLRKCLDLLPTEYRQLLWLKYYEELSLSEICLKLNLNLRSVEGKIYRAKKALCTILTKPLIT